MRDELYRRRRRSENLSPLSPFRYLPHEFSHLAPFLGQSRDVTPAPNPPALAHARMPNPRVRNEPTC